MTFVTAALLLVAVLQVADAWTTLRILANGGVERNPVMRWLIQAAGAEAAMILKVLFVWAALALGHAADAFDHYPAVVYAVTLLYIAVVVNNLVVLRRQ